MHHSDRAHIHISHKQQNSPSTQRSPSGSPLSAPEDPEASPLDNSSESPATLHHYGRALHERSVRSGLTGATHPEQHSSVDIVPQTTEPEDIQYSAGISRALLENGADCVAVISRVGHVESLGGGAASAFGADRIERKKKLFADLWDPSDLQSVQSALAAALSGKRTTVRAKLSATNGVSSHWEMRIIPVFSPAREVERLVAICNDVSELTIAQSAAIEAERQSTAGRLAASIAHEINNPLDAATNLIYLVRNCGSLPDEADRYLAMADAELSRAANISRQMLSFFRPAARVRWIPLDDLAHGALGILDRKCRAKQVSCSIHVEQGLEVYGNEGELRQVLLNLVGNALDASQPGGRMWIRVSVVSGEADAEFSRVRITVADNGHGMTSDIRQRIFQPFFTTKRGHGTGIGLWVSKSLTEQHGGSIRVRSRTGERSGTVIAIFLPKGRKNMMKRAEVA